MASEVKGTYGNGGILYLNSEYKKLAPDNYCEIDGVDLLANFNAHYNPAYAQDVTDIANGITPHIITSGFATPEPDTPG